MNIFSSFTTPASTFSRQRFWFWLVGFVFLGVFLFSIKSILLPFVVGILAAYFLDPVVRAFRQLGWSRSMAAGVITAVFFLFIVLLGILLVPVIAEQADSLAHDLPDYIKDVSMTYGHDLDRYAALLGADKVAAIKGGLGDSGGALFKWFGHIITGALESGLAILNMLMLLFITPVVSFYLLRDWENVVKRIDQLLPRDSAETLREQMQIVDRTLSGFIRGQTNVCLLMAIYYATALSLMGLNFGLVIGCMTGFFLFIPFVGLASGFTLSLIVGVFQFGGSSALVFLPIIYAIGMLLETGLLTPRLVGSKVGLHPLWIIFGMLSGAALLGFVGVLLAVPLTAVVGVLVRFVVSRYLESPLYKGHA